jgi:hypothetical protein
MDGLSVLFGILTIILIGVVIGMNTMNSFQQAKEKEGFATSENAPSSIETQIRKILDPMAVPELCPLFESVRANMRKNEAAGQQISEQEITARVEKTLALAIPGGALPCPLLTYPKSGSTDLEWLDFLQKVPADFGARVVFMALYARNQLVKTQITLDGSLKRLKNKDIKTMVANALGLPPEPLTETEIQQDEAFVALCPPDVADTRRAEKANKQTAACALPEDMGPDQIQDAVTDFLKKIVATKDATLKSKGVDPTIDIKPIIAQAQKAAAVLDVRKSQAEAGTLTPNSVA